MNLMSARHFQAISRTLQVFLLFMFVCLLFLLPKTFSFVKDLNLENNTSLLYLPPMWFTGLYEILQGSGDASFRTSACLAGQSLAAALGVFVITYLVSFNRHFRKSLESRAPSPRAMALLGIFLRRFDSLFLRKPVERSVFHFALRTIFRSPRHRLYLGAYAGVGLALTLVSIAGTVVHSSDIGIEPFDPPLLSIPLVMSFFILCGLRFIFTVPAELNANWIFRLVQGAPQDYLSGSRKVMWAIGVVPLPVALSPLYAAVWGIHGSLLHLIFVFTLAGILTEVLLFRFQKVPFTCSYLPGKANLKLFWFPYVASFSLYAYGMAAIERSMLEYPVRFLIFYAAAGGVLWYLKLKRRQLLPSERTVIFEEQAEPAVRGLNLSH